MMQTQGIHIQQPVPAGNDTLTGRLSAASGAESAESWDTFCQVAGTDAPRASGRDTDDSSSYLAFLHEAGPGSLLTAADCAANTESCTCLAQQATVGSWGCQDRAEGDAHDQNQDLLALHDAINSSAQSALPLKAHQHHHSGVHGPPSHKHRLSASSDQRSRPGSADSRVDADDECFDLPVELSSLSLRSPVPATPTASRLAPGPGTCGKPPRAGGSLHCTPPPLLQLPQALHVAVPRSIPDTPPYAPKWQQEHLDRCQQELLHTQHQLQQAQLDLQQLQGHSKRQQQLLEHVASIVSQMRAVVPSSATALATLLSHLLEVLASGTSPPPSSQHTAAANTPCPPSPWGPLSPVSSLPLPALAAALEPSSPAPYHGRALLSPEALVAAAGGPGGPGMPDSCSPFDYTCPLIGDSCSSSSCSSSSCSSSGGGSSRASSSSSSPERRLGLSASCDQAVHETVQEAVQRYGLAIQMAADLGAARVGEQWESPVSTSGGPAAGADTACMRSQSSLPVTGLAGQLMSPEALGGQHHQQRWVSLGGGQPAVYGATCPQEGTPRKIIDLAKHAGLDELSSPMPRSPMDPLDSASKRMVKALRQRRSMSTDAACHQGLQQFSPAASYSQVPQVIHRHMQLQNE